MPSFRAPLGPFHIVTLALALGGCANRPPSPGAAPQTVRREANAKSSKPLDWAVPLVPPSAASAEARQKAVRTYTNCIGNLERYNRACNFYADPKNDAPGRTASQNRRFPPNLEAMTGRELNSFPLCPSGGKYNYEVSSSFDMFTITCSGQHRPLYWNSQSGLGPEDVFKEHRVMRSSAAVASLLAEASPVRVNESNWVGAALQSAPSLIGLGDYTVPGIKHQFAFIRKTIGNPYVYLHDCDSQRDLIVTEGTSVTISAGGTRLSYTPDGHSLLASTRDLAPQKVPGLAPSSKFLNESPLSDDGRWLGLGSSPLRLRDLHSGKEREFPTGCRFPKFSADSKFLYYCIQGQFPKPDEIVLLSLPSGQEVDRIVGAKSPSLSSDGRHLVFCAHNEFAPDQICIKDRTTGVISQLTNCYDEASFNPAISGDGRFVVFTSEGVSCQPGQEVHWIRPKFKTTDNYRHVYLVDRNTGQIWLLSQTAQGSPGDAWSDRASISSDGLYIVFSTCAKNLGANGDQGVLKIRNPAL